MKVSGLVIGVMVFGAILIGMGSFYTDLFTNADMDLNNTGSISRMRELSGKLSGEAKDNATTTGGTLEEIVYFLKAGINSFEVILTFPVIIIQMTGEAIGLMSPATGGFPAWIEWLISGVIWAIFVFTLISILVKKDV